MINQPTVDSLIRKLGTESEPLSRYALCVIVAKRTRQIVDDMHGRGEYELPDKQKELAAACAEIESGKVTYTKD
ncbi:MAG: DNA-directed RNA polymerase subunit omega [Christensenellaceae bacterium]